MSYSLLRVSWRSLELGCRVQDLGDEAGVQEGYRSVFRVQGSGFRVRVRVYGLGFRAKG